MRHILFEVKSIYFIDRTLGHMSRSETKARNASYNAVDIENLAGRCQPALKPYCACADQIWDWTPFKNGERDANRSSVVLWSTSLTLPRAIKNGGFITYETAVTRVSQSGKMRHQCDSLGSHTKARNIEFNQWKDLSHLSSNQWQQSVAGWSKLEWPEKVRREPSDEGAYGTGRCPWFLSGPFWICSSQQEDGLIWNKGAFFDAAQKMRSLKSCPGVFWPAPDSFLKPVRSSIHLINPVLCKKNPRNWTEKYRRVLRSWGLLSKH
jgi:hypothetical protein